MKIDKAITDVRDAEDDLARRLRGISERHAAEHDLYHLGHTLASKCAQRVDRLGPVAERYGVTPREIAAESPGMLEAVRHKTSELLGRSEKAGLLLLRDLRELYLSAQATEICWVVLMQGAKAVRDQELLGVVSSCHEEAETCGKWVRNQIKEVSPQVLATG